MYRISFLEWYKHTPLLYPFENKLVHGFVKELTLPQHFIAIGSTFLQVVECVRITGSEYIETYRDNIY